MHGPAPRGSRFTAGAAALALALVSTCQSSADGPLTDPIPDDPEVSGLTVVLAEVVTMPRSNPTPVPTDPRLLRWARINYLGEIPDGSGRLFVPDLNGKLYLIKGNDPVEYLDLGAAFAPDFWSHRGLGSGFGFVAFHPRFAANGLFYTVHTEAGAALVNHTSDLPSQANPLHHGVLVEWRAEDPSADRFAGTRREVLRLGFATYIHGFQEINFNSAAGLGDEDFGWLYLAVGDGGTGPAGAAPQDLGMPQGKLLRIDPAGQDAGNGRYGIPASNPFVGRAGALGEIYAYGLRNPHRFSWDHGGARQMFVGNIGEHNVESIYEVRPGDNFGWSEREGPFVIKDADPSCSVYPLPVQDRSLAFVPPVAAYDHHRPAGAPPCRDSGQAVIGGFAYRGQAVPELTGKYLFGDDVTGRIFFAQVDQMIRGRPRAPVFEAIVHDVTGRQVTLQELTGEQRVDLRFGRDAAGEIHVLSKASGKIWKVVDARVLQSRALEPWAQ